MSADKSGLDRFAAWNAGKASACAPFANPRDLTQAAVAAALEGAKQTLNDMIGNTLMTPDQTNAVRGAILRIRALITAPQRDAMQAVIDAAVAEARADDAETIAEFRAALSDWDRHGGQVQHERLLAAEAALAQIGAKP